MKRVLATTAVAMMVFGLTGRVRPLALGRAAAGVAYVTVVDGKGVPVHDLVPADLAVRENGAARTVRSVDSASSEPAEIVVLYGGEPPAGLRAFVEALLAGNSSLRVAVTPDEDTFGSDAASLAPELDAREPKGAEMSFLIQRVGRACAALADAPPAGRRVIVAYVDEATNEMGFTVQGAAPPRYAAYVDALRSTGASFWALIHEMNSALPPGPGLDGIRTSLYRDASKASGGTWLADGLTPADTAKNFQKLAALVTAQYKVTYDRPDLEKPPTSLEVKTLRKNTKIIAPSWPR